MEIDYSFLQALWFILIAVLALTLSLLGYYGTEVYRQAPPIPRP